jgi:hypothetical protein
MGKSIISRYNLNIEKIIESDNLEDLIKSGCKV